MNPVETFGPRIGAGRPLLGRVGFCAQSEMAHNPRIRIQPMTKRKEFCFRARTGVTLPSRRIISAWRPTPE